MIESENYGKGSSNVEMESEHGRNVKSNQLNDSFLTNRASQQLSKMRFYSTNFEIPFRAQFLVRPAQAVDRTRDSPPNFVPPVPLVFFPYPSPSTHTSVSQIHYTMFPPKSPNNPPTTSTESSQLHLFPNLLRMIKFLLSIVGNAFFLTCSNDLSAKDFMAGSGLWSRCFGGRGDDWVLVL